MDRRAWEEPQSVNSHVDDAHPTGVESNAGDHIVECGRNSRACVVVNGKEVAVSSEERIGTKEEVCASDLDNFGDR